MRQRETERDRAWMGEGQRERGRHRIQNRLQALSCQHRAWRGARTHESWDHGLSWSRTLNRLSHPGAPWPTYLNITYHLSNNPDPLFLALFSIVFASFLFVCFKKNFFTRLYKNTIGVSGWFSQLSIWLWLRSWSHDSWVRAPRRSLRWQLSAWSLLQICVTLSISSPPLLSLSLKTKQTFSKIYSQVAR